MGIAGAISFAIDYPPTSGDFPSISSLKSPVSVQPDTVVYFNCTIPPQTPTCQNGVKDGLETGVDCGGPLTLAGQQCPARCGVGEACLCNADCASDACVVDPTSGLGTCGDGTLPGQLPHCAWTDPPGWTINFGPTDAGATDAG